jgi:hypothetical protein
MTYAELGGRQEDTVSSGFQSVSSVGWACLRKHGEQQSSPLLWCSSTNSVMRWCLRYSSILPPSVIKSSAWWWVVVIAHATGAYWWWHDTMQEAMIHEKFECIVILFKETIYH